MSSAVGSYGRALWHSAEGSDEDRLWGINPPTISTDGISRPNRVQLPVARSRPQKVEKRRTGFNCVSSSEVSAQYGLLVTEDASGL